MVVAPLCVGMSEKALGKARSDSTGGDFNLSCRECGKEYDSRQGLVYHYKTDTNECVGLSCRRCDATHLRDRVTLYRHMAKVHGVGHSYIDPRLSDSEWYRRAYVDRGLTTTDIADKCGCSPETAREWKRKHGIESIGEYKSRGTGKDNATWVDNTETTECAYCGESIEIRKRRIELAENNFCNPGCHSTYVSENRVGENHPLYKGGPKYYGVEWRQEIRPKVRERDGHTCQFCGITESEMPRELDVHHLIPVDDFETTADAHELHNLVCACRSCHQTWEGIPLRPDTGGE